MGGLSGGTAVAMSGGSAYLAFRACAGCLGAHRLQVFAPDRRFAEVPPAGVVVVEKHVFQAGGGGGGAQSLQMGAGRR